MTKQTIDIRCEASVFKAAGEMMADAIRKGCADALRPMNLDAMRGRYIARSVDRREAERRVEREKRLARCGGDARIDEAELELARAEGAAAGALYALRLAESEAA